MEDVYSLPIRPTPVVNLHLKKKKVVEGSGIVAHATVPPGCYDIKVKLIFQFLPDVTREDVITEFIAGFDVLESTHTVPGITTETRLLLHHQRLGEGPRELLRLLVRSSGLSFFLLPGSSFCIRPSMPCVVSGIPRLFSYTNNQVQSMTGNPTQIFEPMTVPARGRYRVAAQVDYVFPNERFEVETAIIAQKGKSKYILAVNPGTPNRCAYLQEGTVISVISWSTDPDARYVIDGRGSLTMELVL